MIDEKEVFKIPRLASPSLEEEFKHTRARVIVKSKIGEKDLVKTYNEWVAENEEVLNLPPVRKVNFLLKAYLEFGLEMTNLYDVVVRGLEFEQNKGFQELRDSQEATRKLLVAIMAELKVAPSTPAAAVPSAPHQSGAQYPCQYCSKQLSPAGILRHLTAIHGPKGDGTLATDEDARAAWRVWKERHGLPTEE